MKVFLFHYELLSSKTFNLSLLLPFLINKQHVLPLIAFLCFPESVFQSISLSSPCLPCVQRHTFITAQRVKIS